VGRQAAFRLEPRASEYFDRAEYFAERGQPRRKARGGLSVNWPDETLAWRIRALLKQANGSDHPVKLWNKVLETIDALSPTEQQDSAWRYWKSRALQITAIDNKSMPPAQADEHLAEARQLLERLATELHFYGGLANEDLGRQVKLPPPPAPLSAEERSRIRQNGGLDRALQLIAIGLRSEGVREWNYSLRGLPERELLAAAQLACDRQIWDRCINTSEKTVSEIDIAQRYPTPFRDEVVAQTRQIGLDAAYVYGLIRQESRFVMNARSNVGASGLMQIMPATARWTARKLGLNYTPDLIDDRATNLLLGTNYLKLVLDDAGGQQALGAAAYNAGPGRIRRWREGSPIEAAVWAENIPFAETRDYVKKVLSNAQFYAARLSGEIPPMRRRLGPPIGSPDPAAPAVKDLP
ncbi:MAG: transglycosylase SLT domain-containing protein, partial [Ideonella sp.]